MDADVVSKFQMTGQDVPWLLARLAERRPDHPVLIWEPRSGEVATWTYSEFWAEVQRLAAGLQKNGIQKGDKVIIHSDNCPEMVLAWYACATVGAAGVTTNTRSVAAELTYFIDHTKAVAAITQPQYASVVAASGPNLKWIAVTEDNSGEAASAEQAAHGQQSFDDLFADIEEFVPRRAEPMIPVGIMFTSGTTSRPKAVVHTHANTLWGTRVGPDNIGADPSSVYLIFLPFFHVNAQSWSMWSILGVGGTVVLQPKFSSSRFWDVVVKHDVSHISLIPFVYLAVQGQPIPENKLKAAVFGAIAPPLEQLIGCRVLAAYGMTETVTHATRSGLYGDIPPGSLGKATPGYETLIVDPETGEVLDDGKVGELWLRGTRGIQLFLEYYDNDDANAKTFTEDGWFKTGDMVRMGDGGATSIPSATKTCSRSAARMFRRKRLKTSVVPFLESVMLRLLAVHIQCLMSFRWHLSSRVPMPRATMSSSRRFWNCVSRTFLISRFHVLPISSTTFLEQPSRRSPRINCVTSPTPSRNRSDRQIVSTRCSLSQFLTEENHDSHTI
ncbi:MAG: acyl--CoA ligase [Acidimicrobiia bacterium]|nr:acyl--CoA ligase [Acidimicrobiia bacterium]